MKIAAIDAVVMASGVNQIPLYEGYVPGYKALLPFHGKPSIEYVLDALEAVPEVRRICVVGPQDLMREALAGRRPKIPYQFETGGDTLLESWSAGLMHCRSEESVLVVSADLPLITADAVHDFLLASAAAPVEYEHNVYISVVSRESYTGPYTRFTKPFNQFRDITVCHGNLFIADPDLLNNHAAMERINRLYDGRKTAITSALALGWETALTYLVGVECLHLIELRKMAAFVSRHFGIGIVPVVVDHPEITIDVDEPEDYEFVRELLNLPREAAAACSSR